MSGNVFFGQAVALPIFVIIAFAIGVAFLLVRIFAPPSFPLADWRNYSDKRMLHSPTKIYHDLVCMTGMMIWAISVGLSAFVMMPWSREGIILRILMVVSLFVLILCANADGKNNPDPYVMHVPYKKKARR